MFIGVWICLVSVFGGPEGFGFCSQFGGIRVLVSACLTKSQLKHRNTVGQEDDND